MMRDIARQLFTTCAAVSLLMCVAACVLWAWSYHRADGIRRLRADVATLTGYAERVQSQRGRLTFAWSRQVVETPQDLEVLYPRSLCAEGWSHFSFVTPNTSRRRRDTRQILGVVLEGFTPLPAGRFYFRSATEHRIVRVPYRIVVAVLSAAPATWAAWRALPSRRRPATGYCRSCGYDLRASPERCPECGLMPEAQGTS